MASASKEASVSDRVFSTPELLEAILLKLPHHNVLLKQRVSKLWRDAITTSPTIQQKLFYKISPKLAKGPPLLNPTVTQLLAAGNAFLKTHLNGQCNRNANGEPDYDDKCESDPHVYVYVHATRRVDYKKLKMSSCNSMSISDPPCPSILIDLERGAWCHSKELAIKTVGDLLEGLEDRACSCIGHDRGLVQDCMIPVLGPTQFGVRLTCGCGSGRQAAVRTRLKEGSD